MALLSLLRFAQEFKSIADEYSLSQSVRGQWRALQRLDSMHEAKGFAMLALGIAPIDQCCIDASSKKRAAAQYLPFEDENVDEEKKKAVIQQLLPFLDSPHSLWSGDGKKVKENTHAKNDLAANRHLFATPGIVQSGHKKT